MFAAVSPPKVRLSGTVGEKLSEWVTVSPGTEEPFEILETSAKHGDDFKYSMLKTEVDGKKGFLFLIENTRTEPGTYRDQLTLIIDKPEHNPVVIPVWGNIKAVEGAAEHASP